MRVGQGYDVHAFSEGDHLMLCGVRVPYTKGFKAHSDGDVALHALCDAILGACALGDIGRHFPDTDEQYKDIDSRTLLRAVLKKVQARGFNCNNVDVTVVAEAPKLSPYVEDMRAVLATDLDLSIDRVNVKATTSEKLGFIGAGEGIAAHAIVSVTE